MTERWMIIVGNKAHEAPSQEDAVNTLCREMTCNRADVERQMREKGTASAVYGFCEGHIYQVGVGNV